MICYNEIYDWFSTITHVNEVTNIFLIINVLEKVINTMTKFDLFHTENELIFKRLIR